MKKAFLVVFAALLLVSGCVGEEKSETGLRETAGEEVKVSTGIGAGDWCTKGASWSWANPTTGEKAALVVQGIVSHEGKNVCKAVWEGKSAEGKDTKMEEYFSEDGKYTRMLTYENGKLMGDIKIEGEKMTMKTYDEQGKIVQEFTSGGAATP